MSDSMVCRLTRFAPFCGVLSLWFRPCPAIAAFSEGRVVDEDVAVLLISDLPPSYIQNYSRSQGAKTPTLDLQRLFNQT